MKQLNYLKGKNGELIAKNYLLEKDYKFVEQNYENYLGEIDLIMSFRDILVFVEVKLKVGERFGLPEEMINRNKISRVKRVAESYLVLNPIMSQNYKKYRLDAVCVVVDELNCLKRINHYENIEF
jgi:putative endonuclease